MNREILFRGRRMDGTWAEGYYVFNGETHGIVDSRVFPGSWSEVDPTTIGQYTALLDKNGVKIWEGDILIVPGGAWGIVVWKAPFFEVTVSETESSLYSREWLQECEVFGNRFDNPELMQS